MTKDYTDNNLPSGVVMRRVQDDASPLNGKVVTTFICSRDPSHVLPIGPSNRTGTALPLTMLFKKARQKGWQVSKKGKHLCGGCMELTGRKKPGVPKGTSPHKVKEEREAAQPKTALADQLRAAQADQKKQRQEARAARTKTEENPVNTHTEIRPPVPGAADTPPRLMGPQHRRAIFRALDDVYDDGGQRYLPGHDDKEVAERLSYPWAWVAEVREENFGPAGPDPEVAILMAEAQRVLSTVDGLATALVEQATQLEAVSGTVKDILAKLRDKTKG